jgi:hypothetical protein
MTRTVGASTLPSTRREWSLGVLHAYLHTWVYDSYRLLHLKAGGGCHA